MSAGVTIVRLDPDAGQVVWSACARIHRQQIADGFLSSLGDDFLSCLYEALARTPSSFVFVARDGQRIVGFICGSEKTGRVYKEFARLAGWRVLPILLPKLLSPRRIYGMLETILYPARTRAANLPSAEILNFCVSTEAQGLGVGQRLFAASVEEFRRRCVREIRIVTGVRQQSARRFYDSAGARCVGKVAVHRGSPELVYTFNIS